MAARYVNPENVAAQGQSFYTGLHPVEYQSGRGGGGKNVFGAGSGGSAGVAADRSGADAGRAWNYPAIELGFGGDDRDEDRDRDRDRDPRPQPPAGKETPPETPEPDMPGRDPYGPTSVGKPGVPDTKTGTSSGGGPYGPGTTGIGTPAKPKRQRKPLTPEQKEAGKQKRGEDRAAGEAWRGGRRLNVDALEGDNEYVEMPARATEGSGLDPDDEIGTIEGQIRITQPGKKSPVVEGSYGMWASTIRNRSSSRAMSRARA